MKRMRALVTSVLLTIILSACQIGDKGTKYHIVIEKHCPPPPTLNYTCTTLIDIELPLFNYSKTLKGN